MRTLRVAIITVNFLPELYGVTRTLARLLEHPQANDHQALLLGPECGMEQYAGAEVVGTAGLPLPFYPELKFNYFRPLFARRRSRYSWCNMTVCCSSVPYAHRLLLSYEPRCLLRSFRFCSTDETYVVL